MREDDVLVDYMGYVQSKADKQREEISNDIKKIKNGQYDFKCQYCLKMLEPGEEYWGCGGSLKDKIENSN